MAKASAQELDALGAISQEPAPVVTRVVFTEADLEARRFVKKLCAEAGLVVREDAVGNMFARWEGQDSTLAPVATGSHIDAIPNAGRFDGTVGVLGALEAIRALMRVGFRPRRSIELIIFTAEEPTRFGIGCLGSRLMAGALDAGPLARERTAMASRSTMRAGRLALKDRSRPCLSRQGLTPLSSKCISSKGRFLSDATSRLAWSRPSPRPPASDSQSKAKVAMPALC